MCAGCVCVRGVYVCGLCMCAGFDSKQQLERMCGVERVEDKMLLMTKPGVRETVTRTHWM